MNVIMLVLGELVFGLEGIPNLFVFLVCGLSLCKQLVMRSPKETRLVYVLPSFPLITRSIYCISARV